MSRKGGSDGRRALFGKIPADPEPQFILGNRDWLLRDQRPIGAAVRIGDWSRKMSRASRGVDFDEFDRDAGRRMPAMRIENVGREAAMDFQAIGRRDALVEPQRSDPKDLIECRCRSSVCRCSDVARTGAGSILCRAGAHRR